MRETPGGTLRGLQRWSRLTSTPVLLWLNPWQIGRIALLLFNTAGTPYLGVRVRKTRSPKRCGWWNGTCWTGKVMQRWLFRWRTT